VDLEKLFANSKSLTLSWPSPSSTNRCLDNDDGVDDLVEEETSVDCQKSHLLPNHQHRHCHDYQDIEHRHPHRYHLQ